MKIINELQSLINSETKQSDIANKAIDELYHFNEKNKQLILSLQEKLDFNALAMNDISEHEKLIKSMANDISEFKNALTILCDNKIKNNELDYVNELKNSLNE